MAQPVPSQQVFSLWTEDGTAELGCQSDFTSEGCPTPTTIQEPILQTEAKKRTVMGPQVTVNIYSSGGASSRGSSAGGLGGSGSAEGTGGGFTVADNSLARHTNSIASLEAQMKELSRKVEQLSEKAVYGVMVETRQWSTIEVRPWTRPESSTKARIRFSKKFQSVPAVTASICAADVSRDQNFRVKVYGTDVDVEGFTIHADSWGNTILYSCGVMWTAIGR